MSEELTIQTNNLPESSMSSLGVIQNEREALINAYEDVINLEITDENIKVFKELRLQIRDNRTKGIEPWHTTNKAVSLAIGRTIDAIKNREVAVNKRMEEKLLGAEKHFENLEKERTETLNAERIELVKPYLDSVENLTLHDMDEDVFESYLSTKKRNFTLIQAEELRLEAERVATIKAEKKEQDRIRLENIQLKKEAKEKEASRIQQEKERAKKEKVESDKIAKIEAEKQKALDKEKAKQGTILKKLQEEKNKLEALQKAKLDADNEAKEEAYKMEIKAIQEAEELAKAPVKEKHMLWVNRFDIPLPQDPNEVTLEIAKKFNSFIKWALTEIEKY